MSLYARLFEGRKASHSGFNPKEDPFVYRKDKGHIRDSEAALKLYNSKNPDNPVKHDSGTLGQGSYGKVFPTKSGVVKMDQSAREAKLLKKLPERLKKHSVIPQGIKTGSMRLPPEWADSYGRGKNAHSRHAKITTISRENLKDVSDSRVNNHLNSLEPKITGSLRDTHGSPSDLRRGHLKATLSAWHKHVQSDPHLSSEHKKALKTYAGGMARLIHHGVVPHDLYSPKNMGMRPNGSIVMRDLGVYSVLDDKTKKQEKFPAVEKNVRKLRSLKNRAS